MLLKHFVEVLHHILAALLGESRHRDPDHLAVILRIEAEVRVADSLFERPP